MDPSAIVDLSLVDDRNDPELIVTARQRFDLSPVIEQFGTWAVTQYGMECLTEYYPIEKDRLWEDEPYYGWLFHMVGRRGVDLEDFAECLQAARAHHCPVFPVKQTKSVASRYSASQRKALPTVRFMIFKRDGFRCQICGAKADEDTRLEVDHKIPRAAGGSDDLDNLWTLCFECNRGKGIHSLE